LPSFGSYQFVSFRRRGDLNFPHKTALFATVSHFRGSVVTGQANSRSENSEIANETNDLANFPDATSSKNIEQN
jgi:hypothetical protein